MRSRRWSPDLNTILAAPNASILLVAGIVVVVYRISISRRSTRGHCDPLGCQRHDPLFFPVEGYDRGPRSPCGLQGIAHEKIDPSGYVSVKGELWKAEVAQVILRRRKAGRGGLSVGGLTLKVRPSYNTDKRRWISIAADSHTTSGPPHILGVFLSNGSILFNSGESISRSLLLPAKFRTHSTTDTAFIALTTSLRSPTSSIIVYFTLLPLLSIPTTPSSVPHRSISPPTKYINGSIGSGTTVYFIPKSKEVLMREVHFEMKNAIFRSTMMT